MKNFLTKICIFIISILIFQYIIYKFSIIYNFYPGIPHNIIQLEKLQNTNCDILFFGDSILKTTDPKDKNKNNIVQILTSYLTNIKITTMIREAYHLKIILQYLKKITEFKTKPKLIIIPVNIRSFSPVWYYKPGYQFEKEIKFLKYDCLIFRIFYKPLNIFKFFNKKITRYDYINKPLYDHDKFIGYIKDFDNESYNKVTNKRIKNKIFINYLYNIKKNNPELIALKKIIKLNKNNNLNILFYITPIDYEFCGKFFPEKLPFKKQLNSNIKIINNNFKENNTHYLNLIYSLNSDKFYWKKYPNEHLNEKGRKRIAEILSDKLNGFILKDF